MAGKGSQILDEATIEKKLKRMALEILEKNFDEKEIVLAGVKENGRVVAKNIQKQLSSISSVKTQLMTISLDKKKPKEVTLNEQPELSNKVIIVIDDVSNSGRTLLYALKPFLQFQTKKIQTLVLVERRHNSFPVHPDYVGLSIATTLQEHITVEVSGEKIKGAYLN